MPDPLKEATKALIEELGGEAPHEVMLKRTQEKLEALSDAQIRELVLQLDQDVQAYVYRWGIAAALVRSLALASKIARLFL